MNAGSLPLPPPVLSQLDYPSRMAIIFSALTDECDDPPLGIMSSSSRLNRRDQPNANDAFLTPPLADKTTPDPPADPVPMSGFPPVKIVEKE